MFFLLLGCSPEKKLQKAVFHLEKGNLQYNQAMKYNMLPPEKAKEVAVHYRAALRYKKNYVPAMLGLANCEYHMKAFARCHMILDQVLALQPFSTDAYNLKGIAYEEAGDRTNALRNYEKALQCDSVNTHALYNAAILYNDIKQYDKAISFYDRVLKIDPGYRFAYNNRGISKSRSKRYEEAVKDFSKAIELDADYKDALNGRGLAYYYLKSYASAIHDFERSLRAPDYFQSTEVNSYTYNNLANCYYALGKIQKACQNWHLALENNYVFRPEWKELFQIEDPRILIKRHCAD